MRQVGDFSKVFRTDRGQTPSRQAVQRLALSRGISFAGGGAAFWALSVVLYAQTHSATLVAVAALASFSIPALLSPAAGLLGDRFERRHVMVFSELGGAICFGLMTLFTAPFALLGLRAVASMAATPLVPATSAALPSLVPPNGLERANGALSKAATAGMLVGPALAAIVLTTIGGRWVFLMNTITFLISAVLILSIRRNSRPEITTRRNPVAGFSFLRHHPVLRPVCVAYGVAFIGIGISIPAEIVLVSSFGQGPTGYAALVCIWGLGMVAGASVGARLATQANQVFMIGAAASVVAVGCFGVTAAPVFALTLLAIVIGGLGAGIWEVTQNCLIQRATPDGIRSRVLAANEALMQGGIAAGLAVSGLFTAAIGGRGGFAAAAGTSTLAAAILFLRASRKQPRLEPVSENFVDLTQPRASTAPLREPINRSDPRVAGSVPAAPLPVPVATA